MSISASIDVSILKNDIYNFSAKDLLLEMIDKGWKTRKNNKICYLPLGDELFDWIEEEISELDLMKIILKKEQNNEIIGIVLFWEDTDIGISMLIFQNCQVTFNITINRMKLDNVSNIDITDINWYIKKIIKYFKIFLYLIA